MRRLKLNNENARVGGVCAGLGEYFNIDPVWFRLLFVIGFFTPMIPAVLTYIIILIVLD
jgi:phage shock protein PspC (stress-responsive transcriptional regulator)